MYNVIYMSTEYILHLINQINKNKQNNSIPITNILIVDKGGNDTIGQRNGFPFLTINAAINNSLPYDTIIVNPGIYEESIIIPNNISIIGLSSNNTILQLDNILTDTIMVSMGVNSLLQSFTINLQSNNNSNLIGILYPNNTTANALVKSCVINIDNSNFVGSTNVYGILSNGNATPNETIIAVSDTNININSSNGGIKRGIYVNTSSFINVFNTNVNVNNFGGIGSFIAAEANGNGKIYSINGAYNGASADISQTSGNILLNNTMLVNNNSNGLLFNSKIKSSVLYFSNGYESNGGSIIPFGTSYYIVGGSYPTPFEFPIRISNNCIAMKLSVRVINPSTILIPDFWQIRVNGIITPLRVELSETILEATNTTVALSLNEGDYISLEGFRNIGSGIDYVTIALTLY